MTGWRRATELVAYRAGSELVGKGAFFLITILAARQLSQESFGIFSLGTTIGWIGAVAADFGIQLHFARSVACRPTQAAQLLRAWLRIRIATATVAVFAAAVGLTATSSPTLSRAVFVFTVVYALNGLIEFLHYFYRGLSRSDIESTLTLWHRLITLVVVAVALAWRPDVVWLAIAMMLPALVTFLYSAGRARRLASTMTAVDKVGDVGGTQVGEQADPAQQFEPIEPRDTLPTVITIGIGIVLSALYFRIDLFLINLWQGTNAVALYNAVFRVVEALRLFPAAVMAVVMPALFRAATRRPVIALSAVLGTVGCAATLLLWVSAEWMVPLVFGHTYAPAVAAYRVLLLAFPLMSVNYALTHQLIGWDGHRGYAITAALALIVNVGLNTLWIPTSGIVGAAWSTVATELVVTVGCLAAFTRTKSITVQRRADLPSSLQVSTLTTPQAMT